MLNVKQLRAVWAAAKERRRIRRPGGTAVLHRDARDIAASIQPQRILLLRVDGLGDFVLSLPAFRYFRSSFPHASLEILVCPWNAELARMTGLFDAVHVFSFEDSRGADLSRAEQRRSLAALNLGSFDLLIDMRDFESKRWLADEIPAKFKAGFHLRGGGRALDLILPDFDTAAVERRLHAADRLMMLSMAVTETFGVAPASRGKHDLAAYRKRGRAARPGGGTGIVINPFSGRAIKNWPVGHYADLVRMLQARLNAEVSVFGSESRINGVASDREVQSRRALVEIPGVVDLGPYMSIGALLERFAEADLYIGNDSGTTHLAAELGVPTVALMSGDVEPQIWRPIGPSVVVLKSDVPCAPCFLNKIERCPVDHACMKTVLPESVLSAAAGLLARDASGTEPESPAPETAKFARQAN